MKSSSVFLILLGGLIVPLEAVRAATAAVYADPAYVDATGPSSSASSIRSLLEAEGFTVTTFTGTSSAAISGAFSHDLVVIPSWINQFEYAQQGGFSEANRLQFVEYIGQGGGVIWVGNDSLGALRETIYGPQDPGDPFLATTGSNTAISLNPVHAAQAQSPYHDAPGMLGRPITPMGDFLNPYTYLDVVGEVDDARYIYTDAQQGVAALRIFNGAGKFGQLAWSYENAVALGTTGGDEGWNEAFALMAHDVAGVVTVPEPAPLLLCLGGMLAGVAGLRRARRR